MVRWVVLHFVPTITKEVKNPECLVPTVKHEGGSMTIWETILWYSAAPVITLYGRITASDYVDTSGDQVHLVVFLIMM